MSGDAVVGLTVKLSMILSVINLDDNLHSGRYIFNSHETSDSKLTHKCFDDILDFIDVGCTFIVFAEHSLAGLVGVRDAVVHVFNYVGYLLHVIDKLMVGVLDILHGIIDNLNVVSELLCI